MARIRSQRQVLGRLDRLAGLAAGRARRTAVAPLADPLALTIARSRVTGNDAADMRAVLDQLGPDLLERMDARPLAEQMEQALVSANGIGLVTGPVKRVASGE